MAGSVVGGQSHKPQSGSEEEVPRSPDRRRRKLPAGAIPMEAILATDPSPAPLFRQRTYGVPIVAAMVVMILSLWFSGLFDERYDVAHQTEPAFGPPIETAAPAGDGVARIGTMEAIPSSAVEAANLLATIGLLPEGSNAPSTALEGAVRNYQELAGLSVDGQVSDALLQDLRAVAGLTGPAQN